MNKFLILAATFFLIHLSTSKLYAQNAGEVTGMIGDSIGSPVGSATVSLINLKDSSLTGFYLTDDDGEFIFKKVPLGNFRVVISRMGYRGKAKNFELTAEKPGIRLDSLWLKDNDVRMNDVLIIDDIPPVTLKGDTLEFHADAFKTAPNAVVEDLLKKLPGVEIGTDGTIKINGQSVSKVMVDGKEFFGSDPKLATRNLPAEAIKKVQMFDNKTEGEQLTGVDDGNTDMAINLTLKEKYKEGLFGQLSAGVGTSNRFNAKANVHLFTKKSQYSFIGNGNNTNEAAFSFMELMQFTGGMGDMMGGGSGNSQNSDNGIGFPVQSLVNSQSQGVNTQATGGVRASRDWGEKFSLLGNYFVTYYSPDLQSNQNRNYILPDSSYSSHQDLNQTMLSLNHRLEADLKYNPQKNTKFRFKPLISFYTLSSDESTVVTNLGENGYSGTLANNYKTTNTDAWIFSGDARFSKGFKRKGRSFTSSWTGSYRPSNTDQDINNNLNYLSQDTTFALMQNQQRWITSSRSHNETFKLAYTEPFFYRWLSEVSLNGGLTSSENSREAFSYNVTTYEYDSLVTNLSNDFHSQFYYGSAGLKFKRAGKKTTFTFGAAWQQSKLKGEIPTSGFTVNRDFNQLLPNAQVIFQISKFKVINLTYRSSLKAPSVTQLQPLVDLSNPLFQSTGNPDLLAQTDHSVNASIRIMDPAKNRFLNINLSGTVSENGIAQSQVITPSGITITRPINTAGNWNTSGRLNAAIESKKIKTRFSFEPRASLSHSVNYVNDVENPALSFSTTPRLRVTISPTDSIELSLRGDWTRNISTFQSGVSRTLNSYSTGAELLWMFKKGLTLTSNFSYNIVQGNGSSTQFPLWTASLAKSVFKSQRGEFKFTTFDILKLNTGVSNTTTALYSETLNYNTLHRYYMISFTYRLTPYKPEGNQGRNMWRMMQ